jgi:hypothetical protein
LRWAKHIAVNRFDEPPAILYREQLRLVSGKKYHVLTTNADGRFVKACFPAGRVFAVQGDYGIYKRLLGVNL